jgi:hypothetical protein
VYRKVPWVRIPLSPPCSGNKRLKTLFRRPCYSVVEVRSGNGCPFQTRSHSLGSRSTTPFSTPFWRSSKTLQRSDRALCSKTDLRAFPRFLPGVRWTSTHTHHPGPDRGSWAVSTVTSSPSTSPHTIKSAFAETRNCPDNEMVAYATSSES